MCIIIYYYSIDWILPNMACISIRDLFKRSFVRFTNPSALTFRFSILLLEVLPSKIYVSTFFLSVDQNVYTRILRWS